MRSTRFVDLLAYVLSATEDHNSFKCLYSAKDTNSSDYAVEKSQKA